MAIILNIKRIIRYSVSISLFNKALTVSVPKPRTSGTKIPIIPHSEAPISVNLMCPSLLFAPHMLVKRIEFMKIIDIKPKIGPITNANGITDIRFGGRLEISKATLLPKKY